MAKRLLGVVIIAVLALGTAPAHASLDKCQKRIQGEGAKLQKFIYTALQKCLDAIQKENVKGISTTLGTHCDAGAGCMPTAASFCEKQLAGVYDAANAKPGKSKVDAFRGAIEKSRESGECSDADLDLFTGLGHLLSGTTSGHAAAPPAASAAVDTNGDGHSDPNGAGKFMVDYSLFALEKDTINQVLVQTPQALNLFQAAVAATATVPGAKKNTSCTNAPASLDPLTEEYRPNLCRFGVQCREHACSLNSGTSFARIDSAPLDFVGLTTNPGVSIPINGSLVTNICRPGPASGICKTGGGSCQADEDCTGPNAPPCNLFPGQGEGAAFGTESNFLYLVGEAGKTLKAPEPPITMPMAVAGFVNAACISIIRGEGWCSCNASAVKSNVTVCQDHSATDSLKCIGGTQNGTFCATAPLETACGMGGGECKLTATAGPDACGGLAADGSQDSLFPSVTNGKLTVGTSGTTLAGGCVDLLTIQASLLLSASERGPDGFACSDDDFTAPIATLQVPGTTGTAHVSIEDAVDAVGACNGSQVSCISDGECAPNTCGTSGRGCVTNADCRTCTGGGAPCGVSGDADCAMGETCTGPAFMGETCNGAPDTCGGQTIHVGSFTQGTITGAGTSCASYLASNLSTLSFVGGAPLLNGPSVLGDATLYVKLTCQ